jgi:hypothetical protein
LLLQFGSEWSNTYGKAGVKPWEWQAPNKRNSILYICARYLTKFLAITIVDNILSNRLQKAQAPSPKGRSIL